MSLSFEGDGTITGFDPVLSGFGGLVAVKSALKTDTQSASVAAGAFTDVTGLSITHAVADAANKLIISVYLGSVAQVTGLGEIGCAVFDGTNYLAIGDAGGALQTRVTQGGRRYDAPQDVSAAFPISFQFVHTPGSTASITYSVRIANMRSSTDTLYVGRTESDGNFEIDARTSSSLVIQEVSV